MFYLNESNQNCNRRFIMFRPRTKEEGGSKVESIEKEGLQTGNKLIEFKVIAEHCKAPRKGK